MLKNKFIKSIFTFAKLYDKTLDKVSLRRLIHDYKRYN
jgi:hypothetical protein